MTTVFISQVISDVIFYISDKTETFISQITLGNYSSMQIILDIIFVAALFYWIIMIIRGTRAVHVVIGLGLLALLFLTSRIFKLVALDWLLDKILTLSLVAIPIIFQQELRRGLEKLGQTKIFLPQNEVRVKEIIESLCDAVFELAKNKAGALIVIKGLNNLQEFIETGILLDAIISKELIISIFYPKTPLHDGAIIIDKDRVKAAGCVLPLSFKNQERGIGLRHKAALTLSEETDAHIIVISEEKGLVSYVHSGKIDKDISSATLASLLTRIYTPKKNLIHDDK